MFTVLSTSFCIQFNYKRPILCPKFKVILENAKALVKNPILIADYVGLNDESLFADKHPGNFEY